MYFILQYFKMLGIGYVCFWKSIMLEKKAAFIW